MMQGTWHPSPQPSPTRGEGAHRAHIATPLPLWEREGPGAERREGEGVSLKSKKRRAP